MAIDIAQLVKERFRPAAQAAGSRYFLLNVAKVVINPKDPSVFRATGERLDTGELTSVISRKSSSGQKLPVVGEIMRADKAMPMQITGQPDINAVKAEYFYSYGSEYGEKSFCLAATVMPSIPRLNTENGMWSAQVLAVDSEAASDVSADGFLTGAVDVEIAKHLRPWEGSELSTVTHDVLGRSLWGDGGEAVQGVTPFVTVRFESESVRIYGAGAVKSDKSTDKENVYRLPTREETMAVIGKNKLLTSLKKAFEGLPVEALKGYGVAIIPGVALQVGRDSLSGSSQKYLKVPSQFQWSDDKKLDDNGVPTVRAGYRDANVHIKASRSGRMIVVDTVPAAAGTFSRGVPFTPAELARKNGVAPEQAAVAPAQQAQVAQQQAPVRQQAPAQQAQVAQQHVPAQHQSQSQPPQDQFPPSDDFNEYADFAEDLEDISNMSASFFEDEGFAVSEPEVADDYLEAQMAAAKKRSGPRM